MALKTFRMLLMCSILLCTRIASSIRDDAITPDQFLRDGETIVSAGESFELGFFSPGSSTNRYLGIWYKSISAGTVVWVANREAPLFDHSGVLKVTSEGILVLRNATQGTVWSSTSLKPTQNPVAQLLESGNLVVKDGNNDNPENFLWQSFDYPSETLLPGMKLGRNKVTGHDWVMSSWKSEDDPARGDFSVTLDPKGYPQLVLKKGTTWQYRGGSWNGLMWTGAPALQNNPVCSYTVVVNDTEVSFMYGLKNISVVSRLIVQPSGLFQRFTWVDRTQTWKLFYTSPTDQCDTYAFCGAYSKCNINSAPVCACVLGFVPKLPGDWRSLDWSDGCVRKVPLHCPTDGFLKIQGLKLPDTSNSSVDRSLGLEECEQLCAKNCSCTAFANSDVEGGGKGCLLWFNDLIDIKEFTEGGQDLYIRMEASEIARIQSKRQNVKKIIGIIVACVVLVLLFVILGLMLYKRKKKLKQKGIKRHLVNDHDEDSAHEEEDMELPTFGLASIRNATDNFSLSNKVGEGGFGPVYKGILINGREIAVKRLSTTSGQGIREFKNEVILIANLQHRNLVKLLGCCIEGDEKMLIYEYLSNKSLDFFIFDETRSRLLDWPNRFRIILGIARGLLYLHHDSRLRIIHRDLKASNILLDTDMNPKISDFGLAKTFGRDQSVANTNRVVGTYGYMSPEYAVDGVCSVKSDVFSFGVLVLEIVSGKRNRGFCHKEHGLNLLGHAWRLWLEGRALELIDKLIYESRGVSEVLRCIHVALLCVQKLPEDRPNMSTAVLMLESVVPLPEPKQPGFYTERNPLEVESWSSKEDTCSRNNISTSLLEPR